MVSPHRALEPGQHFGATASDAPSSSTSGPEGPSPSAMEGTKESGGQTRAAVAHTCRYSERIFLALQRAARTAPRVARPKPLKASAVDSELKPVYDVVARARQSVVRLQSRPFRAILYYKPRVRSCCRVLCRQARPGLPGQSRSLWLSSRQPGKYSSRQLLPH